MKIRITNVKFDLHETSSNLIGANAMSATVAGHKLRFPMIGPHQSELSKSKRAKIHLKSPLLQYVHTPRRKNKIDEKSIKEEVTKKYKTLIEKNSQLVADFYYEYYPDYPPNSQERDAILDIQRDAGAVVLSDYEIDPEQSVEKFESQILDLRNNNRKHVTSPTLDMKMRTIGLFIKKLDKLVEHRFQRFNVIYRPFLTYQVNWFDLSHMLLGKPIWCNMVGVPQRYLSNINPISLLTTPFLYGVHTVSLGYPQRGRTKKNSKPKPKPTLSKYNFNTETYSFDKVSNISESESRAYSINGLVAELKIARKHIIKRTFYSKYIPTKNGLLQALNDIS